MRWPPLRETATAATRTAAGVPACCRRRKSTTAATLCRSRLLLGPPSSPHAMWRPLHLHPLRCAALPACSDPGYEVSGNVCAQCASGKYRSGTSSSTNYLCQFIPSGEAGRQGQAGGQGQAGRQCVLFPMLLRLQQGLSVCFARAAARLAGHFICTPRAGRPFPVVVSGVATWPLLALHTVPTADLHAQTVSPAFPTLLALTPPWLCQCTMQAGASPL